MVNFSSILFDTDSYKVSMWKQYPKGTTNVYSYISARGGIFDETVLLGVDVFVKEMLRVPITEHEVLVANEYWTAHGEPFNLEGWLSLVKKHNGFLPILIRSADEGSVIPTGNVLVVVENTDPEFHWITTWVETALLRTVWYMSSVATLSREIKKELKQALEVSGDPAGLPFKLHDFGSRGASSQQTAQRGGLAHLVNFSGTDTFMSVFLGKKVYGADPKSLGFSIPAAEHSTITSWGKSREVDAYANMVNSFSSEGSIYAVVSDSYDIDKAVDMWGSQLKDLVIAKKGTLVIRPDSGDPVTVLTGIMKKLCDSFGYTINDKGFIVLNNVRVIWGDGINLDSIRSILSSLVYTQKYSADNFAFGMGAALLNKIQRDDLGWAMKCSSVKIDNTWVPVKKDPITAPNKVSLAGRVVLYKDPLGYWTGVEDWETDAMDIAYGKSLEDIEPFVRNTIFEDIRKRAAIGL